MSDQINFFPPIELDAKNAGWFVYPGDTVAHFYIGAFSLCGKSWRPNTEEPGQSPVAGDTVCSQCFVSASVLDLAGRVDLILTALAALGPLDDPEPAPDPGLITPPQAIAAKPKKR